MDGTGSGAFPATCFGFRSAETSGYTTRELISEMDRRETYCEQGMWIELAEDRVHWQALLLAGVVYGILLYVPPGLTFTNSTFCPCSVCMCFVCI